MKKMSQVVLGSILTFASAGVLADDHEKFAGDMDPAEPMSVQAQICNLNDGVSHSDYNKNRKRYIESHSSLYYRYSFACISRYLRHSSIRAC